MENQKSPKPPRPVRDMDAPTGIDLNPAPARVPTISKRAFWIGMCILCGVATLLGYGVYRRGDQYKNGTLAADEKNVGPATAAASAITKDIHPGVVNLTTDRDKTSGLSSANNESAVSSKAEGIDGAVRPSVPSNRQDTQPEPTAQERRLAEAYERELRALAAPTGIQSASAGSALFDSKSSAPTLPTTPDSLTALAQLLTPRNSSSVPLLKQILQMQPTTRICKSRKSHS